ELAPPYSAAAPSHGAAWERRNRTLAFGKAALTTFGASAVASIAAAIEDLARDKACILADRPLDSLGRLGVLLQIGLGVLPALADALRIEGEPRAGLLDDTGLDHEIDQLAGLGDALPIHNVELDGLERRRHLVLHHLDAGLVADHLLALLDGTDPPDVEPHRSVELERIAAACGLGRTEHHADLHADLVDEDHHAARLGDGRGELAQGLAHQPRLQARQLLAHLAFEFGLRRERRDRIDDQHVDRARAYQSVGDLERLLA